MKTLPRMQSVYTSLPQWELAVPELPAHEVTLFRLIRVASLGITAIAEPILRRDGLTESSYHALITVAAAGPTGLSPSTLCELIGQTRSNMTRVVRLLHTRQLINLYDDPHDGRSKVAVVTEAGKELIATRGQLLARLFATAESTLTAAEKKALERLLRKVLTAMDAAEDEAVRAAAAAREGVMSRQSAGLSGSRPMRKREIRPRRTRAHGTA